MKRKMVPLKAKEQSKDSNSSWKYLSWISWISGFITLFGVSIFQPFTIFDTLFFARSDGWCNSRLEGVLGHCFGDFHQGISPDFQNDPFPMTNDVMFLSPVDGLIWRLGNLSYAVAGARPTLAIFFVAYAMCVIIGIKNVMPKSRKDVWIPIFLLTSVPTIFALVRMNNICLAFPLFVGYLNSVKERKERQAIIYLVLCTLIKPQFAVLALIELINRKYRKSILILMTMATVYIFLVLVQFDFDASALVKYVNTVLNYGADRVSPVDFYPQNISMSHSLALVYHYLGFVINEINLQKFVTFLSLAGIFLTTLFSSKNREFENIFALLFFTLIGMSVAVNTYYLLIVNVALIYLLETKKVMKFRKLAIFGLVSSSSWGLVPFIDNGNVLIFQHQFETYSQTVAANILPSIAVLLYLLVSIRIVFNLMGNRLN